MNLVMYLAGILGGLIGGGIGFGAAWWIMAASDDPYSGFILPPLVALGEGIGIALAVHLAGVLGGRFRHSILLVLAMGIALAMVGLALTWLGGVIIATAFSGIPRLVLLALAGLMIVISQTWASIALQSEISRGHRIGNGASSRFGYCPLCGAPIPPTGRYCGQCGRELSNVGPEGKQVTAALPKRKTLSPLAFVGRLGPGLELIFLLVIVVTVATLALVPDYFAFVLIPLLIGLVGCWVWLLRLAFRESPEQGLLCLLVPFYQLYYIFSRWHDVKTRKAGSFYLAGYVTLPVSLVVWVLVSGS